MQCTVLRIVTAAAQVAAVVQVHSLARELPHAVGMAKKKKKKKYTSTNFSKALCM